jgi:hypothetical protein
MKKLQAVAQGKGKTVSGIRYMLASKADPLRVFFVGSEDSHFTTMDGGKTFKLVNSVVAFEDIKLHPTHAECMMAAQDTCSGGNAKKDNRVIVNYGYHMILDKVGAMLPIESNNLIGRRRYQKTYDQKIGNQVHIQLLQPSSKKVRKEIKI